jgi:DNA (cytosine-5)-methyltransferase 1
MRRDSAPRRSAGEETAGTITSSLGRRRGQPDCGSTPGLLQPVGYGGGNTSGSIEVAACLTAKGQRIDFEVETFALQAIAFDARQDPISSTEVFGAPGCSSPQAQAVAYAIQAGAMRTNPNSGPDGVGVQADIAYTLEARAEVQAVCAFDPNQITSPTNRSNPTPDLCHTLPAKAEPPVLAFQVSQSGVRLSDVHATLDANNGPRRHNGALVGMRVRRLMPVECERLQGFPDGHTAITVRGKPAADGPRYKALGNSMAVPVMAWIGRRIDAEIGK